MCTLQLDLDLHTGGQIQSHQSLHGLGGGVGDVDQSLVGAALELLTAVLVLMVAKLSMLKLTLSGRLMW